MIDYCRTANGSTNSWPVNIFNARTSWIGLDRLAGSAIFSKLDLQSGYWPLPMEPQDREKTAFSPGPGMGAYEFTRMPFGALSAFQ